MTPRPSVWTRPHERGLHPSIPPRTIRRGAVPIILIWVAITAGLNLLLPQVESVSKHNAVSMSPQDAPSVIAAKKMGTKFQESTSDSIAMVVLTSDQPLSDTAHRYYDTLIGKFEQDARHVEHVQNFWGDLITAAGVQSSDGKAAYVQLNLAGDQGSTLGNQSVEAVRDIVDQTPPPAGVQVYVTGPAPLTTDSLETGDKSMVKMTVVTMIVITIMLLIVYRSISTVLLILAIVGIEMGSARGAVALLGHFGVIDFSTFSVPLLTALAIAAGTDYAIFLIGRYQEARQNAEDPETSYYTAFHGVAHVILGSGLTIAGAMLCLRLTRLAYFKSLAYPSAIALITVVAASLTVAPAVRGGQSVRPLGPKTHDEDQGLATNRYGDRPLAETNSRRGDRDHHSRSPRHDRIQDQLQRSSLHSRRRAGQRRIHGGRKALQRSTTQPRHPDGRLQP